MLRKDVVVPEVVDANISRNCAAVDDGSHQNRAQ